MNVFPFRHILNCLVQNEPGVLSRVSSILAGRGFNIDSLVVCRTEIRDLSRMSIVISGQDSVVEQARRQLEDLVRHSLSILPPAGSLSQHRRVFTSITGPCLGCPRLYRYPRNLARITPRQSLHPWARVPRRPVCRWALARTPPQLSTLAYSPTCFLLQRLQSRARSTLGAQL